MTNNNGWGGKRDGAGPKQKYSAAFIVEIGSLCQARLLAARDKAKAKAKDDLTGQLSDLRDHWQKHIRSNNQRDSNGSRSIRESNTLKM